MLYGSMAYTVITLQYNWQLYMYIYIGFSVIPLNSSCNYVIYTCRGANAAYRFQSQSLTRKTAGTAENPAANKFAFVTPRLRY